MENFNGLAVEVKSQKKAGIIFGVKLKWNGVLRMISLYSKKIKTSGMFTTNDIQKLIVQEIKFKEHFHIEI